MNAAINRWLQLLVPRFSCGHERTPRNSYQAGEFPRCKACHDARQWAKRKAQLQRGAS